MNRNDRSCGPGGSVKEEPVDVCEDRSPGLADARKVEMVEVKMEVNDDFDDEFGDKDANGDVYHEYLTGAPGRSDPSTGS